MSPVDLSKRAIDAALCHEWSEAVTINEQIISLDKNNVEALLRLGYAYTQQNHGEKAKKIYKKVLSIDRYNYVAQKNLDRLANLPKRAARGNKKEEKYIRLSPGLYLEEPGKTKAVHLINEAPLSVLSQLEIGDTVYLQPRRRAIEVRDENKTYLGALPDDLSFRLLRLIQAGNTYATVIKSANKKELTVFIRETMRGKRFKNQPSFLPTTPEYADAPKETKKNHVDDDLDD